MKWILIALLFFPSFALELKGVQIFGKEKQSAELKGVTVIDVWASYCIPCRKSLPILDSLAGVNKDFQWVALSIDEDETKMQRFVQRFGLNAVEIWWDSERALAAQLKPKGLPSMFVVDVQGNLLQELHGYDEGDLRTFLEEFLKHD